MNSMILLQEKFWKPENEEGAELCEGNSAFNVSENEATIGEIEIAAVSLPASEVGGDYFDYFKVSDKEVGIFICDVSGTELQAVFFSGLRSCMHLILEDNTKPSVVIEKLNRMIRKTQNRKMFVTAVLQLLILKK